MASFLNSLRGEDDLGIMSEPWGMLPAFLSLVKGPKPNNTFFFPTKIHFSPTIDFLPLFLNKDGRIRGKRLSKLHYRFQRYSTLTKTVLLESQYLQNYDSLPDFLRPKFEEDSITLQISRFKQNRPWQSWISSKSIMKLTKTFSPNSAIFIKKCG